MNYLGVDYGNSKIGLALGNEKLASPLRVIHFSSHTQALTEIIKIIKQENVKKIVVGVSEGTSAEAAENFAGVLEIESGMPVELQDETLSTKDAQAMAIEAGIGREKRKRMEDSYAATLILQRYLDNR